MNRRNQSESIFPIHTKWQLGSHLNGNHFRLPLTRWLCRLCAHMALTVSSINFQAPVLISFYFIHTNLFLFNFKSSVVKRE
jgi:hypothetical protein